MLLVDLVREGAINMGVFDELLVIAACEDAKLLRPCEETEVCSLLVYWLLCTVY